jgi:hypothetical protein
MDPDAPYMRIAWPFRRPARRNAASAFSPPSQTAAASAKLGPAGLWVIRPLACIQTNSAFAPNAHGLRPKTWSPAANSVTAGPTAATSPASSLPRIGRLGRRRPAISRHTHGAAARRWQSVRLTVVARTLTSTSRWPGRAARPLPGAAHPAAHTCHGQPLSSPLHTGLRVDNDRRFGGAVGPFATGVACLPSAATREWVQAHCGCGCQPMARPACTGQGCRYTNTSVSAAVRWHPCPVSRDAPRRD